MFRFLCTIASVSVLALAAAAPAGPALVTNPKRPDLTITAMQAQRFTTTCRVTVKNIGNKESPSCKLQVRVSRGGLLLATRTISVPGLQVNQSTTVTVRFRLLLRSGDRVSGFVDYDNQVIEPWWNNNKMTIVVP